MRVSFLTETDESFASGLDSRLKLGLCVCGSLCSIGFSSPYSLGVLLAASTAAALSAARPATIAKVYAFSTLMMLFTFGFAALIGLAVPGLIRWNPLSLSMPYMRMLVSVNLLVMLGLSTPVQEVFARLQSLNLPGWVRIPLAVAVRFIPSFMDDCKQIRDAARLRPGGGIVGMWRGFVVPLVFRLLYSADDLATAAELKGIGCGRAVKPEIPPKFEKNDFLVLGLAVVSFACAVLLQFFGPAYVSQRM